MAYDSDGSVVVYRDGSVETFIANSPSPSATADSPRPWVNLSLLADRQKLNDESTATFFVKSANYSYWVFAVLFPQKRELDGMWWNALFHADLGYTYASADTVDAHGGTWTNINVPLRTSTVQSDYREYITSIALNTQRAVRVYTRSGTAGERSEVYGMHLYGTISAGETPNRILFLDTNDGDAQFSKVLDFGDLSRSQTGVRTIKLKNNSSSYSINGVTLTAEDLSLNAGDWYTFSKSGSSGTYSSTLSVGNVAPGGTQLVYMKYVVPAAETLGVQAARLKADHVSLS
jgi:hypothetical protein